MLATAERALEGRVPAVLGRPRKRSPAEGREGEASRSLPRNARSPRGAPWPGGQPTGPPSTQASPDCQPAARLPLQGLTQVSDKQRPLPCYSKSALQVPEPYDGLLVRTARVELARPLRVSGF